MINSLFLASYGIGSGGFIGDLLFDMEQEGIFAYALPFLMIFAIINAILTKAKIFGDNKGINVIVSLSVALMSLQFNFVSYFFAEIFPRMGVLLSIIVVAIILMSLFFDFEDGYAKYVIGLFVAIGFVVIVTQSLEIFNWSYSFGGSWWWWVEDHSGAVLGGMIFVGLLMWSAFGDSSPEMKAARAARKAARAARNN